jgi:hypothetical protein
MSEEKKGGIIAENKGGNFKLVPEGLHKARCIQMVHIGTYNKPYQGKDRSVNEVRITWELPTELNVFKEGEAPRPFTISQTYTLSLNEKANLRKMLEGWRGKKFEEGEVKAFDISVLVSKPCMLQVVHETKKGTTDKYANIQNVIKLDGAKYGECPAQVNESLTFSYQLPMEEFKTRFAKLSEKMQTLLQKTKEYKEKVGNMQIAASSSVSGSQGAPVGDDDDLPF